MTPADIQPDRGGLYRHREHGWILHLSVYSRAGTHNRVRLVRGPAGSHGPFDWWGSTEDFNDQWIHASARGD